MVFARMAGDVTSRVILIDWQHIMAIPLTVGPPATAWIWDTGPVGNNWPTTVGPFSAHTCTSYVEPQCWSVRPLCQTIPHSYVAAAGFTFFGVCFDGLNDLNGQHY